jgi:hypothetical protein
MILLDMLAGAVIATLGIPGVLAGIPLDRTLIVIGYILVFGLFANDLVKVLLLRRTGLA